MLLTEIKVQVTTSMMAAANMTRGDQFGIPVDPADPTKGLRWKKLMEMKDEDYDALETYFLSKQ